MVTGWCFGTWMFFPNSWDMLGWWSNLTNQYFFGGVGIPPTSIMSRWSDLDLSQGVSSGKIHHVLWGRWYLISQNGLESKKCRVSYTRGKAHIWLVIYNSFLWPESHPKQFNDHPQLSRRCSWPTGHILRREGENWALVGWLGSFTSWILARKRGQSICSTRPRRKKHMSCPRLAVFGCNIHIYSFYLILRQMLNNQLCPRLELRTECWFELIYSHLPCFLVGETTIQAAMWSCWDR